MFTHRVRLHFRAIAQDGLDFEEHLESAQKVYRQYGIRIEEASGMSLALPEEDQNRLAQIDDECVWDVKSGELLDLQQRGGEVPANEILVFYVKRFVVPGKGCSGPVSIEGCGGHAIGRPACVVTSDAGRWVTAHEIGHVLLSSNFKHAQSPDPSHSIDPQNLMARGTIANHSTTPILTVAQILQIKKSPCCVSVVSNIA